MTTSKYPSQIAEIIQASQDGDYIYRGENKAIELDPTYAAAYYNRSIAYAELEESSKARKDRDKAIELDPNLKNHNKDIKD